MQFIEKVASILDLGDFPYINLDPFRFYGFVMCIA